MDLVLDSDAAVPVYEQIRSQLAGAIASGSLAPGDRLPTARDCAAAQGIAVNTVTRAYTELSRAGLISSMRRFGTVVTGDGHPDMPSSVLAAVARLAMRAHAADISPEQAVDLLRAAMYSVGQHSAPHGDGAADH